MVGHVAEGLPPASAKVLKQHSVDKRGARLNLNPTDVRPVRMQAVVSEFQKALRNSNFTTLQSPRVLQRVKHVVEGRSAIDASQFSTHPAHQIFERCSNQYGCNVLRNLGLLSQNLLAQTRKVSQNFSSHLKPQAAIPTAVDLRDAGERLHQIALDIEQKATELRIP